MDKFKIENFKREYGDRNFPWFRECHPTVCRELRKRLKDSFCLDAHVDDLLQFTFELNGLTTNVPDEDAKGDDFSLSNLTKRLGLICGEDVYINWYRFDNVDLIHFRDLSKYFDDIWYPDPDDIDIFDDTVSWVLYIDHEGYIHFAKP